MSNPLVKITDAALDAVSHTRTTAGKVFNGATHIAGTGFQVARRVAVSTISGAAGVLQRDDSPANHRVRVTAQTPAPPANPNHT